ncbi:hypothetical protein ACIP6X_02560 [Streptomyces coeruleorubidus]|uniref:hypothetical protein n=1 Tax=Streptomyces coeruleorubidus TaxID=116188 RepID=UPI0038168B0C
MAFEPDFPKQEIEISWNPQGEATVKLTEMVGDNVRTTTHFGWVQPNDPVLTVDSLNEERVTVKLGRIVGATRAVVEGNP